MGDNKHTTKRSRFTKQIHSSCMFVTLKTTQSVIGLLCSLQQLSNCMVKIVTGLPWVYLIICYYCFILQPFLLLFTSLCTTHNLLKDEPVIYSCDGYSSSCILTDMHRSTVLSMGRYKPGLWTLDWPMDWTMDWIMDWLMDSILDCTAKPAN